MHVSYVLSQGHGHLKVRCYRLAMHTESIAATKVVGEYNEKQTLGMNKL